LERVFGALFWNILAKFKGRKRYAHAVRAVVVLTSNKIKSQPPEATRSPHTKDVPVRAVVNQSPSRAPATTTSRRGLERSETRIGSSGKYRGPIDLNRSFFIVIHNVISSVKFELSNFD
jgi:hypothetical protein